MSSIKICWRIQLQSSGGHGGLFSCTGRRGRGSSTWPKSWQRRHTPHSSAWHIRVFRSAVNVSHGCSRLRKKMIEDRRRGCFVVIFDEHRPTRFSAGMFHGMSLLLSWHRTLADVTQNGVLKLMNLDGLTVYHTNNHLEVHELEEFLRFIHTFSKDQGASSGSIMFQEKFGSFWTVIAAIFLNEYKNNTMRTKRR